MSKIIIGQEAICPDGVGRVSKIGDEFCGKREITIDTHINNRSCNWAEHNVELIDPRNIKERPYREEKMGELSIKRNYEKAYVIMCNDFPEAVVLDDEENAQKEMDELITKDYMQYAHFPTLEAYRKRNYWRISLVEVS